VLHHCGIGAQVLRPQDLFETPLFTVKINYFQSFILKQKWPMKPQHCGTKNTARKNMCEAQSIHLVDVFVQHSDL
jgi:hypothetical protein